MNQGLVYFLQLDNGLVKVGRSTSMASRMAIHRSSFGGFSLIGLYEGSHADEIAAHRVLRPLRIEGKNPRYPGPELYRLRAEHIDQIKIMFGPYLDEHLKSVGKIARGYYPVAFPANRMFLRISSLGHTKD